MYRWALVSNTTVAPLVQRLRQAVKKCRIDSEFFTVEHGDSGRQVFSSDSELYAFNPDLILLYLDLQQIRPTFELFVPFETAERRELFIAKVLEQVTSMVQALRSTSPATLLLNNFPVQPRTALGIGQDYIYKNTLRRLNLDLIQASSELQGCYVFDCDSLWAEVGYAHYDRRFEMIAQFPFSIEMQQALVDEWMRYFRALNGLTRKCIVVDLDNTLWGGILGEDGPDGIQMGDTPEGRPFRRFQQSLKALNRRGLLLAINSKNNLDDVKAVFEHHPDLLLSESDFAAMQINWEDKATNLARIARELNIGLQHLVFLDDNPSERAWVRERLPAVLVPEMPDDVARNADILTKCETDVLTITGEDLRRSQMYSEDRERRKFRADTPSFDDFLRNLNLKVTIEPVGSALLNRAAQLCARTNQFNLTTHRHNLEALTRFSLSPSFAVLLMQVQDRFGDYGWCGLAIVEIREAQASIDTFLLSCRVLGKNVEFALFAAVVRWVSNRDCNRLEGNYLQTDKNLPCRDFLQRCGLKTVGARTSQGGQSFVAKVSELPALPVDHIDVTMKF